MKKLLYILTIGILVSACGGDDEGDTPDPVENQPPNKPEQSAPVNNLLCIDNAVTFEWTASTDPNGDAVSYELQIATNNSFSENMQSHSSISTSNIVTLEKGVAYYWRVKALDSKNASSDFSSTYSFYTEGEGESNHLPFAPSLVSPEMNKVIQTASVTLEWTASDVDTDDTLTFDVYFDTMNPPITKVSDNQSELTREETLESSKTYYWKVVVKDNHEGEAIGQVWSFKTD